ncbi:hypothetical protein Tco_0605974 [Tanacetum coccineum]
MAHLYHRHLCHYPARRLFDDLEDLQLPRTCKRRLQYCEYTASPEFQTPTPALVNHNDVLDDDEDESLNENDDDKKDELNNIDEAAAIFLCVSAGSFDISVFGLGWQYGMQSAIYGVVVAAGNCGMVQVPWSNERPLENKELNAIIGAWFTLWPD